MKQSSYGRWTRAEHEKFLEGTCVLSQDLTFMGRIGKRLNPILEPGQELKLDHMPKSSLINLTKTIKTTERTLKLILIASKLLKQMLHLDNQKLRISQLTFLWCKFYFNVEYFVLKKNKILTFGISLLISQRWVLLGMKSGKKFKGRILG